MLRILFRHFFSVILLGFFLWPKIVSASEAPNLISPSDNSSVTDSLKFEWEYKGQCIETGSCFRFEIDNNQDFSSPEKATYSNGYSYSPRGISEGNYYWRVKARDTSGSWSDWSKVFKVVLGNNITENVTNSSKPSPQSSLKPEKSEDVFLVKDLTSEVNSDSKIEVSVILKLKDKPNTNFYLKGAFREGGSLNYFGQTYSGSSWTKNGSSYASQYKIKTDANGVWEGKIKVRPDQSDSGFKGSNEYGFKVGRYTDSGNGPVWSNELTLKINDVEISEPSPSSKPDQDEEELPEEDIEEVTYALPSVDYDFKIASVAGIATNSDNISLEEHTRVLDEKKINWLLIFLGSGVLVGGVGYGVYQVKVSRQR